MGLKRYVKKIRKVMLRHNKRMTKPIIKPLRKAVKALIPDVNIDIPEAVENPLPAPSATEANLELVIGARRKRANRGSLRIERTARTSSVPSGTSVNLPR